MDARTPPLPRVIVVDDDAALLRALRFSLELEGFQVESHRLAASVAPEKLPAHNACLVIDYFLPGYSGLDLLSRLRACQVTLPAIIITSNVTDALRRNASDLGAVVVEKPLLGPDLVAEIRTQLHEHQPQPG